MSERTIGILGGMGPEATVDLFLKVIKATPAHTDQEHIHVIVDSDPSIPDRTAAILGKGPDPSPVMIASAQNLERAGADLLVISCNTAHYFHQRVQESVQIPVLHIMNETARYLRENHPEVKAVGLLATTGTVNTGLYQRALEQVGIEVLVPDEVGQAIVMDCIYGQEGVKAGHTDRHVTERLVAVSEPLLAAGAGVIICGCTELPLVLHEGDLPVPVVDPTHILALAAVREARA